MTTTMSNHIDNHADTFQAWLSEISGRTCTLPADAVCAIYVRSNNHASTERQFEICMDYAVRKGLPLQTRYNEIDHGATCLGQRTILLEMSLAARRGDFQFIVVEHLDRITRDEGFNRQYVAWLQALGVEVHVASFQRAVRRDDFVQGVMGEDGRRLLQERTQRGRLAMAGRGLVPGVASFGYSVVPGRPGHRAIDRGQAAVVAQAFEMRAGGAPCGRIAQSLNEAPTSTRAWTAASVTRMLRNPLYGGLLVYGSHTTLRNSRTGTVSKVACPRAKWIVTPVEHLRLVDRSTWDAVQATFGSKLDVGGARA